jgi:GxxExxY protein
MGGDRGDESHPERDTLTYSIIEAVIRVHAVLGPGFVESIYHHALVIELRKRGLTVEHEVEVEIEYDRQLVGKHRLDLVVDRRVILELKTVEELSKAHYAQVRSYLRATGLPVALLINFSKEKADYRRIERN